MKLKEKLALEFNCLTPPRDNWCSEEENAFDAYLAGFEAARSMAAEAANNCAVEMDYCDDLSTTDKRQKEADTQYNMACWEISLQIKKLGEEELT